MVNAMNFNKLLSILIIACGVVLCEGEAQNVSIEYRANGEWFVQYNSQCKTFSNTEELSNNLSGFTNNLINIESIIPNENSTEFRNINSNEPCVFEIKGNKESKLNFQLYFGDNVHFSKFIAKNFNKLKLANSDNAKSHCLITNYLSSRDECYRKRPFELGGVLNLSAQTSPVEFTLESIKK